jgi:hypothetical protein
MKELLHYWKISLRADWLAARLAWHALFLDDWSTPPVQEALAELTALRREILS